MTRQEAIEYLQPIAMSAILENYRDALFMAIDALRFQDEAVKKMEMTVEQLATMDYSAPADAPNINKMSWQELAAVSNRIGPVRGKSIVNARTMKGMVYTCPADLLKIRNIGPGIAATFIGKVRFGLED